MKHKILAVIALSAALTAVVLSSGCSNGAGTSENGASQETPASVAEPEENTEASEVTETPAQSSTSQKGTYDEAPYGEAENAYAGEVIETSESAAAVSTGTECSIPENASDPSYTIRIDSIELTPDRSEYETTPADAVVKVTYTVKNLNVSAGLMVGAMSFRLVDENNTAFGSYFLDGSSGEEYDILPIEEGQSGTFAVTFAVTGSPSGVTVIFDDFALESGTQYLYTCDSLF